MGVFSRHRGVLEADDSPMRVKAARQLINAELDAFLNDLHGEFDADTRFAITWFEQNGMKAGDFGTANSIATAYNALIADWAEWPPMAPNDPAPMLPVGGLSEEPAPNPTRFAGTVMISADRPARDMHQIVEAIIEQLTTLPGAKVSLRLKIDAEIPSGLDRARVRTLIENANTLGFIDKSVT